jgi:hypothetical protein
MVRKALVTAILAASFLPVLASAQSSQDDLRNAIQASLLSDQRTQAIPPEQLNALVDALVAQAQSQHMSAEDILWRPTQVSEAAVGAADPSVPGSTNCVPGFAGYLCQFNAVFGFEGGSFEIPLILLVVSGLLIAVLWEVIAHHRKHLAKEAAAAVPVWEKQAPPPQAPAKIQ